MQLYPSTTGVLMAHPGDVILFGVEAGEGKCFELIHRGALLLISRSIFRRKGQHPMRISPVPCDAVDQLGRTDHIAPQNLRSGCLPPFTLMVQKIGRDRSTAPAPSSGKFDQHQPSPSPSAVNGESRR